MIFDLQVDFDFDKFISANYHKSVNCLNNNNSDGLLPIPDSLNEHNTIIHQVFWDEYPDSFAKMFGIDIVTVSSIKQNPGNTIPWHRDMFHKTKTLYPNDKRILVRANVFLEDWKRGHFLQYEDTPVTSWRAGYTIVWDSSVAHTSMNAGLEPKYTLQVSGFLHEN